MSISTSQVWAIIGLAALIWLALSIVGVASGGGISIVFNLADIIPALLFGWWLYERWGWRWGPLHAVGLLSTPVVIGTWRGTLESFWKDPKTGELPAPKTVYLTIAQTVTSVSVRLLTDESSSEQVAGAITRAESGFPAISYNYRNKPQLELRQTRSPIHYGAAVIEIEGRPATGLNGEYWTDRNSSGKFTFREHAPRVAQTFEQATTLAYGAPRPVGILDGLRRR